MNWHEQVARMVAGFAVLMCIIAMAVNILSTWEVTNDATLICGWQEGDCDGDDCTGSSSDTYAEAYANCVDAGGSDDDCAPYSEIDSGGKAWLAFGILGLLVLAFGMSINFLLKPWDRHTRWVYAGATVCLFLAFVIWAGIGCQAQNDNFPTIPGFEYEYELGASFYLMLLAFLAAGAATFLEFWGYGKTASTSAPAQQPTQAGN